MRTEEIKILLVEDNPDDIELTLRAFKKHKYLTGLQDRCDINKIAVCVWIQCLLFIARGVVVTLENL
ncbi:MAG: hypothetical protein U9N60_02975 [Thermodesulfobacteriota bacterium]|nr:hypothetical protein [Thermodesulfobacteriota bacterium]